MLLKKGACRHHQGWKDFFKPDENIPPNHSLNRKQKANVHHNRNEFIHDNLSVRLFLLPTVENPIPDRIEAIPNGKKQKYVVVAKHQNKYIYHV
jgi:hypothetical protein